jgi:RNA ligase
MLHYLHPALRQHIEAGNVIVRKHPSAELYILNYAQTVQYNGLWDEHTLACRGLILDAEGQVVARPFPKFFNLDEYGPEWTPPAEPFVAYEKLDGSLGILYWLDDEAHIATRGSFASEQAQWASARLRTHYAHAIPHLDRSKTYLFEIIYPENRIVLDYRDRAELVLLAVLDTATGVESDNVPDIGFPLVRRFDGLTDLAQIRAMHVDNEEGFVLRYQSGLRVKIKFAEYVRLHRILTQVSTLSIWEYLATNQPFDEVLEKVPDEFYEWVRATVADLQARYTAIESECRAALRTYPTRKETALYFQTQPHPGVLFQMHDGKDYSKAIWRLIKPEYSKPFSMNVQ